MLAWLFVILGGWSSGLADGPNLLYNGSFEEQAGGPVSWTSNIASGSSAEAGSFTAANEGGDSWAGSCSVYISRTGSSSDRWYVSKNLPSVTPSEAYELSASVCTRHLDEDDSVRLAMVWLKSDKSIQKTSYGPSVYGSSDWRTLRVTDPAPTNAAYVRPLLLFSCGSAPAPSTAESIALFDDVSFHTVTRNGGFESEDGNDPANWIAGGTPGYITNGIPGRDVVSGTHAVKLLAPVSNGSDRWYPPSFAYPVVTAGKLYSLSADIKTEGLDSDDYVCLKMLWRDDGKGAIATETGPSLPGNRGWLRQQILAVAPSGSGFVTPQLTMNYGSNESSTTNATASFDNVTIEEVDWNDGFEVEDGTYPLFWRNNVLGSATYQTAGTEGDDVFSGTHAISIHPAGNSDRWYIPTSSTPEVTPETMYELTAQIKSENFDDDDFLRIAITWLESSGSSISTVNGDSQRGDRDWHLIRMTVEAPANAASARVTLTAGNNGESATNMMARFDNVFLTRIICNGGFETGSGSQPDHWIAELDDTASADWISSGTAGNDTASGSGAVRITQPGEGSAWIVPSISVPPVHPGESYTLSAQLKTEQLDEDDFARLAIRWLDCDRVEIGESTGPAQFGDNDWHAVRFSAVAPIGAAYARPVLYAGCAEEAASSSAAISFDDADFGRTETDGLITGELSRIDLGGWDISSLGTIVQSNAGLLELTVDSPGFDAVSLTPPAPITLPDSVHRIGGWYVRCEGDFDIAYIIRDANGQDHTVKSYTSAPYYSDVDWDDMADWSRWNQVYSYNFSQPDGAALTNQVIPEYRSYVQGFCWPKPLKLTEIQIVPVTAPRLNDAVSPADLTAISNGVASLILSDLWVLDEDELAVTNAWYNHGRRRLGWETSNRVFPDDLCTTSGVSTLRLEIIQGYQGPVIWQRDLTLNVDLNSFSNLWNQAIDLPELPEGSWFLHSWAWDSERTLLTEREMRIYGIRGADVGTPDELEPRFSMTTGMDREVLAIGTTSANLTLRRSLSAFSVSPNSHVRLQVTDWKENSVIDQTVPFEPELHFTVPVGPRNYRAEATLLDNGVVCDRTRLHFAVKTDGTTAYTAPTHTAAVVRADAEYYRPWYSSRPHEDMDITDETLQYYDTWIEDEVATRSFTHVDNTFPWSEIEVLPGAFRWEEGDRRNQVAVDAGADLTVLCSPLGPTVPTLPDWWNGELQLNQHGRPLDVGTADIAARTPPCDYWYSYRNGLLNWASNAVSHFRGNSDISEYRFQFEPFGDAPAASKEHSYYDYSQSFRQAFKDWLSAQGKTPYDPPKPLAVPGVSMGAFGPDLSEEWVALMDFKTYSVVDRISNVVQAVRSLDATRPLSFYRGPRNGAMEAAIPVLQQNGGNFHDEGAPNFFANALASLSAQAGIRYTFENHDFRPASREIIDSDIFYGSIYNKGWTFNYRWHERFENQPWIGDALDFLSGSMPVLEDYVTAQADEPQVLVFGSRIDALVNDGRFSNYNRITGIELFTSLFSYFQIPVHFADEYANWMSLTDFDLVFVCGEVMRSNAVSRIEDFAQNGGRVVLVDGAGTYCPEQPSQRDILEDSISGLNNVLTMSGLTNAAPDGMTAPGAPYSPDPNELEPILDWAGITRTVWAEQSGVLDQRFECLRRTIDENSFYVGVFRRFSTDYTSITDSNLNYSVWGRTNTTVSVPVTAGIYSVEKIHRETGSVSFTLQGGVLSFDTDPALTGELQIYRITAE